MQPFSWKYQNTKYEIQIKWGENRHHWKFDLWKWSSNVQEAAEDVFASSEIVSTFY